MASLRRATSRSRASSSARASSTLGFRWRSACFTTVRRPLSSLSCPVFVLIHHSLSSSGNADYELSADCWGAALNVTPEVRLCLFLVRAASSLITPPLLIRSARPGLNRTSSYGIDCQCCSTSRLISSLFSCRSDPHPLFLLLSLSAAQRSRTEVDLRRPSTPTARLSRSTRPSPARSTTSASPVRAFPLLFPHLSCSLTSLLSSFQA